MSAVQDYSAYGLRVRSAIALPYRLAAPSDDQPDVYVRFGAVPDRLESPRRVNPRGIWEAAPNRFLFRVGGIARYLVADGMEVLVEPDGGSERNIGITLVGSAFAALLQQRGVAAFHASAVATPVGAALFLGASGAGKSTLLAGLVDRGYAMLADDLAGVDLDSAGRPVVLPAFPTMRLWDEALDALDWRARALGRVSDDVEKFMVSAPRFHEAPLAIGHVFVVIRDDEDIVERRTTSRAETLAWLTRFRYRARFMEGLAQEGRTFRTIAAMARKTRAVPLRRSAGPLRTSGLVDCIEARMNLAGASGAS